MNTKLFKTRIRPLILSAAFAAIGNLVVFILVKGFNLEMDKWIRSILIFTITTGSILLLFPGVFKIPHGKQKIKEWLADAGLYKPDRLWIHVLLGVILGIISLSGMLLGSIFTGKYVFDWQNISAGHFIFSLTPGIWEEVMFRGVILILLMQWMKDLKKAFWWQIIIFTLCHLSDFTLLGFVDLFSIGLIAMTFSFTAIRTRCLISGIIYHYLHDAFLFLVQNPEGKYFGFADNAVFYTFLWSAMLINLMIVFIITERIPFTGRFVYTDNKIESFSLFKLSKPNSEKAERLERFAFIICTMNLLITLAGNLDKGFMAFNLFLAVGILINLIIIIKFRHNNKVITFAGFIFNAIASVASGYILQSEGSEKAYIVNYLLAVIFFIMALFSQMIKRESSE